MKPFQLAQALWLFLLGSPSASVSALLQPVLTQTMTQRLRLTSTTFSLVYTNDVEGSYTSSSSASDLQRREWIDKSLTYYTKVMREERRRNLGQLANNYDTAEYQDTFTVLAKKHYFALRKIKSGQWRHAETIYRKIISELVSEDEEECDHAQLAITTLLLALLLQRMKLAKETRSVFLHFFRVAVLEKEGECACSAKVLQAYALFEMKQGNGLKSLELVQRAVQLDATLEPVLHWKQFRDALERKSG